MKTQTPRVSSKDVLELANFAGIFCDAYALNGNSICFVSLWGRPSRIMALYGAITEGHLTKMVMGGRECAVHRELDKRQTRMPESSRYGSDMMHVMLHADVVLQDKAGIRVLLDRQAVPEERLWAVLGELSDLALLPHWQKTWLQALRDNGFVTALDCHRMAAERIDLSHSDAYQALLQAMIRKGRLTREAA